MSKNNYQIKTVGDAVDICEQFGIKISHNNDQLFEIAETLITTTMNGIRHGCENIAGRSLPCEQEIYFQKYNGLDDNVQKILPITTVEFGYDCQSSASKE